MSDKIRQQLSELSQKLNYSFSNFDHLALALTHRSASNKNNERLEFLGDAIINFMIAEAIYQKYPKAKEGDLSRLRSSLVSRDALGELAKELNLGAYLRLGHGELKSGGHNRLSILSCAMEAIIGAVYLDADFETCKKTVLAWFQSRLDTLSLDVEYRDAKTQLQEYVQGQKVSLPQYTLLKTTGRAHDQMFHVQCEIADLSLKVEAKGTSRQKAEKAAAQKLLDKLLHGN